HVGSEFGSLPTTDGSSSARTSRPVGSRRSLPRGRRCCSGSHVGSIASGITQVLEIETQRLAVPGLIRRETLWCEILLREIGKSSKEFFNVKISDVNRFPARTFDL